MHNPKDIFNAAEMFYQAAKLMNFEINNHHKELGIPAVTTSAFCTELYLKCIVTMEQNKTPRIHDLRDLFDKISPEFQKTIMEFYEKYVAIDPATSFFKAQGETIKTFDERIEIGRKIFEDLRYPFENEGQMNGTGWLCGPIKEALREAILDRHPDWLPAWAKRFPIPTETPPTPQVLTVQIPVRDV